MNLSRCCNAGILTHYSPCQHTHSPLSPSLSLPLPLSLSCSPTSDGSACAIVCSEDFARAHSLTGKAVEILAIEMATDLPSTFNQQSCMKMVSHSSNWISFVHLSLRACEMRL